MNPVERRGCSAFDSAYPNLSSKVIVDYFAPKSTPELNITFQGRHITIIGIGKEAQVEKFGWNLGWLFEPIMPEKYRSGFQLKDTWSVRWHLPATKMSKLIGLIDSYKEELLEAKRLKEIFQNTLGYKNTGVPFPYPSEKIPRLVELLDHCEEELLDVARLRGSFLETRDYEIDECFFPLLFRLFRMPSHSWPELERIKQAFRLYLPIEKLFLKVTEEMRIDFQAIKKSLSREKRGEIKEALEEKKTVEEREKIFERYQLSTSDLTVEEKAVFFDFVALFIVPPCELFLTASFENLIPADQEDDFCDLSWFETNAREALETTCNEIGVQVIFMQEGRKVCLGSITSEETEEVTDSQKEFDFVEPESCLDLSLSEESEEELIDEEDLDF